MEHPRYQKGPRELERLISQMSRRQDLACGSPLPPQGSRALCDDCSSERAPSSAIWDLGSLSHVTTHRALASSFGREGQQHLLPKDSKRCPSKRPCTLGFPGTKLNRPQGPGLTEPPRAPCPTSRRL